ncbi:protein FAM205C isoform X2 [Rattus rattus]|uniref:protein FAM205C isoform X2 n=1 Tax=Rattus rattus TaxID=10117 RepID=UPI0013F2B609|nr:protein FAM205C isoform X2 [Rattus rattus]
MLIPPFILWDVGYSVYTYGSIFIIALIIWQVKRSHRGLRMGPTKSCAKCFRRIKQTPSDRSTRAKRTSKEEAEKLQKLLDTMKSQGWLPQEGSVRRLLCPDPSCSICNAMTLEIQQLLGIENKRTSSSLLRPSRSFSCLEALSLSKALADRSSELTYQDTRDVSLSSRFPKSQETDQQSTRSATPSIGDAVLQCYHSAPQQQLDPQGSKMTQDAKGLSSSSTDEPGVPANQQKKRKKTKKLALKNQAPTEAEMENKMTFFSHWVNPEVKCDRQEESLVFSKFDTGAKLVTVEPEKTHSPVRDQAEGAEKKKKPECDLKAKPLRAKRNI